MRWHKLAAAGLTVVAAAAVASLIAGGVGSAATTAAQPLTRATTRGTPPPQPSRRALKASVMPQVSPATTKIYLKIMGVTGEVVDGPYTNSVSIASWSWDMTTPTGSGGGGGTPTASLSDLNVTYPYDRSVPQLQTKAVQGTAFGIQLVELGSANQRIREIDLTNARVESVQVGSSGGTTTPFVSVSFSYTKVQTTYFYTNSDNVTSPYRACYDLINHVNCN